MEERTNQIADFRNTERKVYLHRSVNVLIQSYIAKYIPCDTKPMDRHISAQQSGGLHSV